MKIIRSLLGFFTPDECVGCRAEGVIICVDCRSKLYYPDRCVVCKRPAIMGVTCASCQGNSSLASISVATEYSGIGKDLVSTMKYRPSTSTARVVGQISADRLPYIPVDETVVAHIPTTGSRIRERGFDQARIMAKAVANQKKIPYIPLLRRITKSHQVGSGRKERLAHMKDAFLAKNTRYIQNKTVILVDDVLTTGSTMESAAKSLKKAGAKRVVGLVFARAE